MPRLLALLAVLGACTPAGEAPIYTSFQKGEIGGSCAADSDCKGGGTCLLDNFLGFSGTGFAPVGGYCTRSCTVDSECGPGRCVLGANNVGYCTAFCDGPSHCRADYICRPNKHCEPQGIYRLDCDPKAQSGICLLSDGNTGGCIRNALGEGMAGACIVGCGLGVTSCPTSGTQKSSCHYIDATSLGDPFQGLLCYFDNFEPPTGLGGACTNAEDCVSGSNCVSVDGASSVCLALCSGSFGCANGARCGDFVPKGPFGFCEP